MFYILVLSKFPLFLFSQYRTGDTLFYHQTNFRPHKDYRDSIVVISVDDESMFYLNRSWPWGRDVFAAFLERIRPLDPKVIGFDFSFVGKSRDEKADRWLADEIAKSGNIVMASHFDRDSLTAPYGYILPSEIFLKASKTVGFINVPHDRDGTVRRSRVLLELADRHGYAYSFPLQLACAYLGLNPQQVARIDGHDVVFRLPSEADPSGFKEIFVPLDRKYHIPISFRGYKHDIRQIPFWKIIAGKIDKKDIEGKIVLVGATSPLIKDIHEAPVGFIPGVFINAYQTLMILEQDFLKKLWPRDHWIFLLAMAAVFTLIFYRLHYWLGAIVFLAAEFAIYKLAVFLFVQERLIFSVFSTMLTLALVFLIAVFYKGLWTFLENIALHRIVITDALTGLYSHRYLSIHLKSIFDRSSRFNKEFCFAMIDIDFFKKVNDTYGHEQGNAVLVQIAKLLQKGLRDCDVVGRYGGEEFWLTLSDCNVPIALQILERIKLSIEREVFLDPKKNFFVTISVGLCSNKDSAVKKAEDLIECADKLLYQAKSSGRNRICIHRPATA